MAKVRFGIALFNIVASIVCLIAGDYIAWAVCLINAFII
jgi:hypothetical protein